MSFIESAFTAVGSLALAYAAADMVRHYLPNYYRVLTPILILGAVDAYVPQFTMLDWGFQTGLAVGVTFALWYLRKKRVVRQDGTIDNG
jgi:hypothetical protein